MKKILIAAALGAVVMFAWQFVYWGLLSGHDNTFEAFPDEEAAVQSHEQLLESDGTYYFPSPRSSEYSVADGPVILTFYQQDGNSRPLAMRMAIGFLINFIALFIISGCLRFVIDLLDHFVKRFVVILGIGVASGILTHLYQWNWFLLNDHFTLMILIDFLTGWILAGIVISLIMKPVHKYIVP